jgi:hypothetical protein
MAKETVRDFIPWSDVEFTRDTETNTVKRMFAGIKRAINLNRRTLREQPKSKLEKTVKKYERKVNIISSIGYRGEE